MIAWGGRYEGAWDNNKRSGRGTYTSPNGDRCVRHGRGVPGVSRGGAHAQRAGAWRAGSLRQDMTDAQVCRGGLYGRGCGMRAVGGGGCVGGCGEVIAGRYEGEFSNAAIHGQGSFTAAKAGWTLTGAFAHWRPTEGELTLADGRRFAVLYAADCAFIYNHPTPSSKVRVGSVSPRARTSMVLERRRRASAALLVPACAGVCVCPATEHRPHLTTWPCRRPCSRRGAEAASTTRGKRG